LSKTSISWLIAGFATNTQFQQTLENQTDVLTAQAAVVQNLQQTYGVTLATPNFLTTSFSVGKIGANGLSDGAALAPVQQHSLRRKWNSPRRQIVYTTYPNLRQTSMSIRQSHVIRSSSGLLRAALEA
jgi:hypothetical protein